VRELAGWLTQRRIPHVLTHEPGDSWLGQQVRRLVLSNDSGPIGPRAETLLYLADKAQHVDEVVAPALARGEVVVSDRYVDSLLAYQATGRQSDLDEVERAARWATRDVRPDLTVVLDVDPAQAVHAIAEPDRIESAGAGLHLRVRQGFLDLAARDPEHYLVIGARGSREVIARTVRGRVAALLGLEVADQPTSLHLSDPPATMEP